MSPAEARRFFWDSVHGFSVYYEALAGPDGQKFLAECKSHGKGVCAWTVNTKEGMRECIRWGLGSCITDKPDMWTEVKAEVCPNPGTRLMISSPPIIIELSNPPFRHTFFHSLIRRLGGLISRGRLRWRGSILRKRVESLRIGRVFRLG